MFNDPNPKSFCPVCKEKTPHVSQDVRFTTFKVCLICGVSRILHCEGLSEKCPQCGEFVLSKQAEPSPIRGLIGWLLGESHNYKEHECINRGSKDSSKNSVRLTDGSE